MSLYANQAEVKKIIERYCELRRCANCRNYFCELDNLGMHKCRYHPGEYDPEVEAMSCCGEKSRHPNVNNPYASYSHIMTWGPQNRCEPMDTFSKGCKWRDCEAEIPSGVDKKVVHIDSIASLVPYMNPPMKERPGFRKGPLRLIRQQPFPKNVWYHPPLERSDGR